MTTRLMLRIAAAISLLFTIGHSLGGLQKWSPAPDNGVLKAMTDVHFRVMGVSRSYLDLYLGLGWTVGVFMLLQTILLWQLASLAGTNAAQVRPMILPFAFAALATGILAAFLILPVPALFSGALLLALVLAWLARR